MKWTFFGQKKRDSENKRHILTWHSSGSHIYAYLRLSSTTTKVKYPRNFISFEFFCVWKFLVFQTSKNEWMHICFVNKMNHLYNGDKNGCFEEKVDNSKNQDRIENFFITFVGNFLIHFYKLSSAVPHLFPATHVQMNKYEFLN